MLWAHREVAVDVSEVEPVLVMGDRRLLGQAVRNLLDNAARYAREGIAVSCHAEGDVARIEVADDGPGIAPQDRERVFGRFVRLEEGREAAEGRRVWTLGRTGHRRGPWRTGVCRAVPPGRCCRGPGAAPRPVASAVCIVGVRVPQIVNQRKLC